MNIYAENILDHYRNPRGKLHLSLGEEHAFHSESNPACGDEITVGVALRNGRVASLQWDGTGCAISQAAMSMLSEQFGKKQEGAIEAFTKENMLALLGVPIGPRRLKCALLGLHACKNALRKAKGQEILGWAQSVLGLVSSRLSPP